MSFLTEELVNPLLHVAAHAAATAEPIINNSTSVNNVLYHDNNETTASYYDDNDTDDDGKSVMDYLSVVVSNLLLYWLIFGLSATVDVKNLQRQWRNKFAIGTGVAMQFIIMPALGFVAVMALRDHGMTEAMGITLLVVTSSPGGSYSNWWCSTFNADLALSVTMTSISSLISLGMLPANLFFYTYLAYGVFATTDDDDNNKSDNNDISDININNNATTTATDTTTEDVVQALDFKTIFITLAVVMAAIISGLLAGYRWDYPTFHIYANRLGSVCGLLLIVFSVLLSFAGGTDDDEDKASDDSTGFFSHSWAFYVGVALPCLVGIALANILSRTCFRLSPPECVTLSIECCYQNVGIATSVAVTMFQDDPTERAQAIAVPLFYGVVEAVAIGIYCIWAWKAGWTKAPPNENICIVITKTYEVVEEEHDDDTKQDGAFAAAEEDGSSGHQVRDKTDLAKNNDSPDITEQTEGCNGTIVGGNRCRIVSEDNTTSTCCTVVSFETSNNNGSSTTPTMQNNVSFDHATMGSLDEGYVFTGGDQFTNDDHDDDGPDHHHHHHLSLQRVEEGQRSNLTLPKESSADC